MQSPSSVLITGGCGFLGSHLAEHYLNQNKLVVCVDNFSTNSRGNQKLLQSLVEKDRLHIVEADVVQDWTSWVTKIPSHFLKHLSHVFHFASPASPPVYQRLSIETLHVNSIGLERALHFADSHKARLIFSSTSEVYGDALVHPQPETYWGNVNSFGERACYDESKRFGEALLYSHNQRHQTPHGLVRIFNTFGPRMEFEDGRVVINFLTQALRGNPLTIYGTGQQTRSFCFVSDLIEGIVKYAASNICTPMNLGNDKEYKIVELAECVLKLFPEKQLQLEFLPLPVNDPKQRRPDLTRAFKELHWQPTISLEQGLKQMLAWVKAETTQ